MLKNIIEIPWSLLTQPFLNRKGPIALNYGALGQIIGHESAHVVADIMFKKRINGSNIPAAALLLKRISACLVEQYSEFCPLKGKGLEMQCLNGTRTLIENIADNIGNSPWLPQFYYPP